jgi:hypothetical protein
MKSFKAVTLLIVAGLLLALGANGANDKPVKHSTPVYGKHARMPRLVSMPDGDVLLSWVEPTRQGHVLKYAVQKEGVWKKQGVVAQGGRWFVNWADFHSVVAIDESFWVAHWLAKRPAGKTYDYDVELAISNDAGDTWRPIGRPYQDATPAEHGFVTIFPEAGQAGIVWLDGRNAAKKQLNTDGTEKKGHFELRYARVQRDGTVVSEQVLDSNTCTCCWTAVASTPKGAVAAWRGRTDAEIRDNRLATLTNGQWSQPSPLGAEQWEIAGCPVNGPALAAINNQVVSAWFTAQGDKPRIRAAFSEDAGQHFATPVDIDNAAPLGRIGVLWQNPSSAYLSWMSAPSQSGKKSWLMLRKMTANGVLSTPIKVVELSAGRDTGVPQMVATKQGVLLAWTHAAPNYGLHLHQLSWAELEEKSNVSALPSLFNGSLFETHHIPFTVCRAPH